MAPEICPACGAVTEAVTLSFNLSYRHLRGKVKPTGETAFAVVGGMLGFPSELFLIGSYCEDCEKEWFDPVQVTEFTEFLQTLSRNSNKEV